MANSASSTLQTLIEMQKGYDYTRKTDEEIRAQATSEYQSYYDQLRLAARQRQSSQDLALAQQRAGLQSTYDRQREASARQYAQAYSQSDRQMLSRGMQRSSYNAQTLANIQRYGAEAQQDLWSEQGAAEMNIDQQRQQLASQLAEQLMQYDANQLIDIQKRMYQLEDQDYQRWADAQASKSSLTQQIYQAQYQQERDAVEDEQWERQFKENQRQFNENLSYQKSKSSSSGGGGRSSSGGSSKASSTPAASGSTGGSLWDSFTSALGNLGNALLGGGSSKSNSSGSTKTVYMDPYSYAGYQRNRAGGI